MRQREHESVNDYAELFVDYADNTNEVVTGLMDRSNMVFTATDVAAAGVLRFADIGPIERRNYYWLTTQGFSTHFQQDLKEISTSLARQREDQRETISSLLSRRELDAAKQLEDHVIHTSSGDWALRSADQRARADKLLARTATSPDSFIALNHMYDFVIHERVKRAAQSFELDEVAIGGLLKVMSGSEARLAARVELYSVLAHDDILLDYAKEPEDALSRASALHQEIKGVNHNFAEGLKVDGVYSSFPNIQNLYDSVFSSLENIGSHSDYPDFDVPPQKYYEWSLQQQSLAPGGMAWRELIQTMLTSSWAPKQPKNQYCQNQEPPRASMKTSEAEDFLRSEGHRYSGWLQRSDPVDLQRLINSVRIMRTKLEADGIHDKERQDKRIFRRYKTATEKSDSRGVLASYKILWEVMGEDYKGSIPF